jgi:hypothetical protein
MIRRRRWLVRFVVIVVIVALLVLFRHAILQGLAEQLIVDEQPQAGAAILILGGDRSPELAVKAFQDGQAPAVLLVDWWPQRPERLGITPPHAAMQRQVLVKHGIPDQDIALLPGQPRDLYQVADSIGLWLEQNPDKHLNVYCGRFDSRQVQVIFGRVLGEQRRRVHAQAVAHPEYDEHDWWCNKMGLKDFWGAGVRLAFVWTHGRPRHDQPEWDPDAYEKELQ